MEKIRVIATAKHPNRPEGEPHMIHPNHLPKYLKLGWVQQESVLLEKEPEIVKPTPAKVKEAKQRVKK